MLIRVVTPGHLENTSSPPEPASISVRDRTQWRNIQAISEGALGWNHRTAVGKIGLYGKRTLLVTPPHDGY
jgi:hypothetical protein